MSLQESINDRWGFFQAELFPFLGEEAGPLCDSHEQLVIAIEYSRLEHQIRFTGRRPGRPRESRLRLARAFLAKAVCGLPTTRSLIDRLHCDRVLRQLCGWLRRGEVPSEATFSRAFAEFAGEGLTERVHDAIVKQMFDNRIAGHLSRDSTAVEARGKAVPKPGRKAGAKRRPGRPRKGEEVKKPLTRLQRQPRMTLEEMIGDLPSACDFGVKKDSRGRRGFWKGYKLHADVADGGIPVSCLLTSASLHDSQAALPLAAMSAERADSLCDLMDSAYDADEIRACSLRLGHVPLIEPNPRRNRELKAELHSSRRADRAARHVPAETARMRERSTVERFFGRLKDQFGAKHVRVRGNKKVFCHLMFGVIALLTDQMMRMNI